jgi:signal transduction histidine kinase
MAERIRAKDWSQTPLGPIESWPQSLATAVRIILGSQYPMFVWWGRDLVNIYNDAYAPMLGQRHPGALGGSAPHIWHDVWPQVGPQTELVLNHGQSTWNDRVLLVMERNGYTEEAYFTFSYSPVPGDDGSAGGVFCAVTEETERVIGERRLQVLRRLSAETTDARTVRDACKRAGDVFAENGRDISFALIYLVQALRREAHLECVTGLRADSYNAPSRIALLTAVPAVWPLQSVLTGSEVTLALTGRELPGGAWPEPAQTAMVLPLVRGGEAEAIGFIVLGASPRRVFDDSYRAFFELVSGSLSSAVTGAQAYEEARSRAEALAELNRAKTVFFSNVSHEFRTPLTLMLGPVEDLLSNPPQQQETEQLELLRVVHRNALRLQKLVNTLLDFSRIEAGRIQASYEATSLAEFTTELASAFESAMQRAALQFSVECLPLSQPVFVDREMWEKIVLNLLSNAFKYTLNGAVTLRLREVDRTVQLSVTDTGAGIPEQELPHIFERFRRVQERRAELRRARGSGWLWFTNSCSCTEARWP